MHAFLSTMEEALQFWAKLIFSGGFAYANEQLKDNKGNGWKMSRRGRLLFC